MHPCCLSDCLRSRSSDEPAISENDMRAENDFINAGHKCEDCSVGNDDDGDTGGSEGFGEEFGAEVVFAFAGVFADYGGVGGFVVIGEGFRVYDRELPLRSRFEEEFLHGCGGGMG